jgi:succinate dehydrogenase / fumarate reductase flavoprotein subunit
MQGLADGYFVLPYTIQNYLAGEILTPRIPVTQPEFEKSENSVRERLNKLILIGGKQSADQLHRKFGLHLWETVGMARNRKELEKTVEDFRNLREEFWTDLRVTGTIDELNPELEKASRVADFIEMGELMARDALQREESCGGHFREEYQTEEGEAKRDDNEFMFVGAWEYTGQGKEPLLHKESLIYENIKVQSRNYKI